MSIAAQDGAWVSEARISRFDCTKCGEGFHTSKYPMNEHEASEFVRLHIIDKHGGLYRVFKGLRGSE